MKQPTFNSILIFSTLIFLILFSALFYYELKIENQEHKQRIGYIENIGIIHQNEIFYVNAKIDTGAERSSIDYNLAKELGIYYPLEKNATIINSKGSETREIIPIQFYIRDNLINSTMSVANRSNLEYPILIGENDIKEFIIDPSINPENNYGLFENPQYNKTIRILLSIAIMSIFIVFVRQFVGASTYGLFGPIIIALSFYFSGLFSMLILYGILLTIGIMLDKALFKLNILTASRGSILLHSFVLIIIAVLYISEINSLTIIEVSLPFIIIMHIIDRFSLTSENYNYKKAILTLINTFIVAILIFFMIDFLEEILSLNGLIILFLASFSLAIIFSFYSGLRFNEFSRFYFNELSIFGAGNASLNPKKLGMNYRNSKIINKYNSSESIKTVNNKILFKKKLFENNVPSAKIKAIISSPSEINQKIGEINPPFVIKPSKGSGGKGIIIINRKDGENYFDTNEKKIEKKKIIKHIEKILGGVFSLESEKEEVLIEEKIKIDKKIQQFAKHGIPDIRVIVFKNEPMGAMIRIPTKESGGKANLSQGALGAGIDINTGKITTLYDKSKRKFLEIPKEYQVILPDWGKVIEIAKKATKISGLGYSGIDLTYSEKGIIVIEANARPGLEIQNVLKGNCLEKLKSIENIRDNKY